MIVIANIPGTPCASATTMLLMVVRVLLLLVVLLLRVIVVLLDHVPKAGGLNGTGGDVIVATGTRTGRLTVIFGVA